MLVYGKSNHLLCIDNNSKITNEVSDDLCRISSGSPIVSRQLYTNDEEKINYLSSPIIINGINNAITRGDLLDRAMVIQLKPIKTAKSEDEIVTEFTKQLPLIFGGLCDCLVNAIRDTDNVVIADRFRLIDFVKWVTAATGNSMFANHYQNNISHNKTILLHDDPVGALLIEYIELQRGQGKTHWTGTSQQLLITLKELNQVGSYATKVDTFPKTPKALSSWLTRLQPLLREIGVEIKRTRKTHTGRSI